MRWTHLQLHAHWHTRKRVHTSACTNTHTTNGAHQMSATCQTAERKTVIQGARFSVFSVDSRILILWNGVQGPLEMKNGGPKAEMSGQYKSYQVSNGSIGCWPTSSSLSHCLSLTHALTCILQEIEDFFFIVLVGLLPAPLDIRSAQCATIFDVATVIKKRTHFFLSAGRGMHSF